MNLRFLTLPILLALLINGWIPRASAAPSGSYLDWRYQVWPSSLAADDTVSGPEADPDGDGFGNFVEYALGLDPRTPDPESRAAWNRTGSSTNFSLQYRLSTSALEARVSTAWTTNLNNAGWDDPDGTRLSETPRSAGIAAEDRQAVFQLASRGQAFARLAAARVPTPSPEPRWVWFEAEPPNSESNPILSAGQMVWISPGGSIQKTVTIPSTGTYQLWVRKFWNPQAFRWRTNPADPWRDVNRTTSGALLDLATLGTNTSRRMGWFNAGSIDLTAGSCVFRLEVAAGLGDTTAYDCFLLTRDPFVPRGTLKPGETLVATQPGWTSFQPENDVFTHSPIDLRHLNEPLAGQGGFIQARGDTFVHGTTSEPIRFWGINAGSSIAALAHHELDVLARTLAKRGVNLVRFHGPVYATSGPGFGQVDTQAVANVHYLTAALKREGIYSSLSIYFPLWVTLNPENTAFPGYTNQHPFGLLYFNTNFQATYRGWWQHLLRTTNHHTGLPLRDDPALAFVELVNEDSTLFWTFDPYRGAAGNLPDAQRALVEKQFGDWLLGRYKPRTLSDIRAQIWMGLSTPQDNPSAGRMGLRGPYDLFTHRTRRDQDTAEFLAGLMRTFYRDTASWIRTNLNYRGVITASNWKTASPRYLDPLDRYANTAADALDRHGYFDPYHVGTDASWSIKPGQVYDDRSAVTFSPQNGTVPEFTNPLFDIIYDERPSTLSEVNWPLPNRYRADMTFLAAAYGSLQGSDSIVWFAAGSSVWEHSPAKFAVQTPAGLAQFPANAWLYRQGLVQTGPPVVEIELALTNLFSLHGAPVPAPVDFTSLRGSNVPPGGTLTNVSAIDALAFLAGRVHLRFTTNNNPQSRILDLSPQIDRAQQKVTSRTDELRWDYGRGLVTLNAPAAQGATGFLRNAGRIQLDDLDIESPLDYGSILAVALDGQPLAQSARMLIQVMSEEEPFGWTTSTHTGPRTITNAGTIPIMIRNLGGTITFKQPHATALTITPLDENGYRLPGSEFPGPVLNLLTNRLYYLLER